MIAVGVDERETWFECGESNRYCNKLNQQEVVGLILCIHLSTHVDELSLPNLPANRSRLGRLY